MESRLAGSGAEGYLSTPTSIAYEEHERLWDDELYLYGDNHPDGDPSVTYVDFQIESIGSPDARTCSWFSEVACQFAWKLVVVTELSSTAEGQPGTMKETLLVAPADGAVAEVNEWMISGAARGELPETTP